VIYRRLFLLSILLLSSQYSSPGWADTKYELVPSTRIITRVIAGMTIDDVIRKIYPKDKVIWGKIKRRLIDLNPYSFQQYSEKLITGSRLRLVDVKRVYDKELSEKVWVGHVAKLIGEAVAKDINGDTQELVINSQVYEGDRITTNLDSMISIFLKDGAEVHLKEDSIIKITEYIITDGFDNSSSSILDLLRGGLRKITGAIAANSLAHYELQTGFATIGVRGTEYVAKFCNVDDCRQSISRNDPRAQLHAAVFEGIISLTTDRDEQILMALGEYGTASRDILEIKSDVPVPVGFLDDDEAHKFNITSPQMIEKAKEEYESSGIWSWVLGILILVAIL
jgi:hypothetical protein